MSSCLSGHTGIRLTRHRIIYITLGSKSQCLRLSPEPPDRQTRPPVHSGSGIGLSGSGSAGGVTRRPVPGRGSALKAECTQCYNKETFSMRQKAARTVEAAAALTGTGIWRIRTAKKKTAEADEDSSGSFSPACFFWPRPSGCSSTAFSGCGQVERLTRREPQGWRKSARRNPRSKRGATRSRRRSSWPPDTTMTPPSRCCSRKTTTLPTPSWSTRSRHSRQIRPRWKRRIRPRFPIFSFTL